MNPFHRAWHWFVTDDMRLRRWLRGFLMWLLTSALQMANAGADAMEHWTAKRWAIGFGISGLAGVIGLINLGEKNQPAAEEKKP